MSLSKLTPDSSPLPLDAGAAPNRIVIDSTRPRQTETSVSPFREVLAGGVSVLMGGAAVATHVMGAPRLAAAISGAENRATSSIVGEPTGALGPRGLGGASTASPGGQLALAMAGGAGSDTTDLAAMQAMQKESQVFNLQLLGLQEQVQQDSQRFSTLSNVMRAKHDTAKAAVSNIRS
jgi:hypothetical protein